MDRWQWFLSELVKSVRLLASPSDGQANFVRSITRVDDELVNCDELALNFDDSYVMVPQLLEDSLISRDAADCLDALSAQLRDMSGSDKADLWTLRSVRHAQEWERVRELARASLELLPEARGKD